MPFFRKKPVVIEARQFDGSVNSAVELRDWIGDQCFTLDQLGTPFALVIRTLEGDHRADAGDWIIRGVKGEFYPIKADIFASTYEAAVKIKLVSAERPD
jgi:hypothetical protein